MKRVLFEQPKPRSIFATERPAILVTTDDGKLLREVVEFLCLVHDCNAWVNPAGQHGYWIRFPDGTIVITASLRVAQHLYGVAVEQPQLA